MFELPKSVETLVNVSSIAITVFGWLPFSRWILKIRARSRFWGISAKKAQIRVIMGKTSEVQHPRGYNYTTVSAADAEAAAHIISGLALAYGSKYKLSSRPCNAFTADFWNEPVVLVGGQTRNDQTKLFVRALNQNGSLPYEISDLPEGKRYFRHYLTDKRYVADIKGISGPDGVPGDDSIDYALIVRAPNPLDGDAAAESFMFYGLHAFGTVAAANLMNPSRFKRFDQEVRAKWRQQQPKWTRYIPFYRPKFPNHFAILVHVRVTRRSLHPEVIEVLKVKPNKTVLEKVRASSAQSQLIHDPAAPLERLSHDTPVLERRDPG